MIGIKSNFKEKKESKEKINKREKKLWMAENQLGHHLNGTEQWLWVKSTFNSKESKDLFDYGRKRRRRK